MQSLKMIGISGTNGAGKDTVGDFLAKDHGWLFVSVTDILRDELKRRDLPIERKNLRMVSTEWRRQYGLGVLIDKAVKIFEKQSEKYKGLAIASLRNPGEADRVHELGGKVVWVDADPKIRYQRIYSRARGTEDKKTFEEFIREEKDEMTHSGDHHTLSMADVLAKSDIVIQNNSDNMKKFGSVIEQALGLDKP